jgi:predicted NBD/HSP70 family sugar kinase
VIAAFKPTRKMYGGEETEMAVYVGIDVHKKYCQAALMNNNGSVVRNSDSTTPHKEPQT